MNLGLYNIYHEGFENLSNVQWEATETELNYLKSRFDRVEQWSIKNNVPIFLGEFGTTKEAPQQTRINWTKAVREEAEKRKFSWGYWEFGSAFGVYDVEKESWNKPLLDALMLGE